MMIPLIGGLMKEAGAQDSITDIDDNTYPVITIGSQVWMAANLRATHDAEGRPLNGYCFQNSEDNCLKYGMLYSWDCMMNGDSKEKTRGICPQGWHIPSDQEWETLCTVLGGADHAGKRMREDSSLAFFVQYAGNYFPKHKIFSYLDEQAYYWTSSMYTGQSAWIRNMSLKSTNVNRTTVRKDYCFSVRCTKD